MNVYELEKLATPGLHESHVMYGGPLCNCQTRCEDCLKRDRILAARKRLDAHCRNNFLRALEALKEVHDDIGPFWLKALIKELEEMK